MLLWQPVKCGRSQTLRGTTFTLCFGIQHSKSTLKQFNGNNPATSCPKLVNFRPVISGVHAVKTHIFCRDSPAIWRRSSFVTLAFSNGLEDRNLNFSRVIGNHFWTHCRNLVRFGSVTPELSQSVPNSPVPTVVSASSCCLLCDRLVLVFVNK